MENDMIAQLRRQLQNHLQSLQSAGVEWLPQGPPLEVGLQKSEGGKERAEDRPATTSEYRAESAVSPGPLPKLDFLTEETAATASLSPDQRKAALRKLQEEVKKCTKCAQLASTRTQTVFADGPIDAELCFIGEAPGAEEDAQGLPFVGAAGQLLNDIITKGLKMKREEVYICNILKCSARQSHSPPR